MFETEDSPEDGLVGNHGVSVDLTVSGACKVRLGMRTEEEGERGWERTEGERGNRRWMFGIIYISRIDGRVHPIFAGARRVKFREASRSVSPSDRTAYGLARKERPVRTAFPFLA